MSVFYYEPFYDIDRLLDAALTSQWPGPSNQLQSLPNDSRDGAVRALKPKMDLHENKGTNTVTATFELPGMKKEEVSIEVHNGRLSVSGENKLSMDHEESGYAVRERKWGKFVRALVLPQGIKDKDIKASMENGVLSVTFPKSAPELAPKNITIS
ncbi:small heat shock protein [Collybia nuda]|uniref:Small heat shock protein n=1 Tax=Collybia nuda TaxID=64659 RepID=A0A9P5XSL0_9AGAR|nr:small heat shock protein [Collybia nuda]